MRRIILSRANALTLSALALRPRMFLRTIHSAPALRRLALRSSPVSIRLQHNVLLQASQRFFASVPDHTKLAMPALSPTMKQGNLAVWHKKEGDKVSQGDVLADVETDKATVAFEAVEEGYLAKIIVPAGTKDVPLGKVVAILVESKEDVPKFKDFKLEDAQASPAKTAAAPPQMKEEQTKRQETAPAAKPKAPQKDYPTHTKLAMPALSPTMKQGNMAAWHKKEGDKVSQGDVLADVETDKATVAFEAVEEGYLAKILVPAGTKDVPLGKVVAILVENADDVAKFKDYQLDDTAADSAKQVSAAPLMKEEKKPQPAAAKPEAAPAAAAPTQQYFTQQAQPTQEGGRVFASPAARRVAGERGIDLSQVSGTGPSRRILRADVEEYQPRVAAAAPAAAAMAAGAPGAGFRDFQLSNIRQVIAQKLMQSKQTIPHYYLTIDLNMNKINKLREELNGMLLKQAGKGKEKDALKLSLNDFIIKAAALACKKVPAANSSWMDSFIRQYDYVDMSIAVQTDQGLLAPVIRDADIKGLAAIARDVKDIAARARANKLKPEEFTGGTFTVSNLGMFGVKSFSAIINPPQACILAVGTSENRVIQGAKPGEYTTAPFMTVTLSCDHRVVDGAVGAQWLQAFRDLIESPSSMLL